MAGELLVMRKQGAHRVYFDWALKLEWEIAEGGKYRTRKCAYMLLHSGEGVARILECCEVFQQA